MIRHMRAALCRCAAIAVVSVAGFTASARANDLPPPEVRPSAGRRSTAPAPRAVSTPRTTVAAPAPRRYEPTRTIPTTQMPTTQIPVAQPRLRVAGVPPTYVPPQQPTSARSASEPLAWQIRKRHSTYVPPAHTAPATSIASAASRVPVAGIPTLPSRAAPRTTVTPARSTYVAPSPVAARTPSRSSAPRATTWNRPAPAPSGYLSRPQVRKSSPSYAELDRAPRPTSVVSRPRSVETAASATPRRTLQRRPASGARRAPPATTARAAAVPAIPGGSCQPEPTTRRVLPLVTPPGCSEHG